MTKKDKLKKDPLLEIAQLQESENRWRTMAESSPDHILTLAPDLTIQYSNHPSPGLTIEDLIGVPITSFVDDEKQEEIKSILFGVISTGQAAIYETEYPTPDGGMIYYETHAIPRKSAGKVIGLTLNSRDCSKRKSAELELRESEEKYRALYDTAPLPYQSLDEEGRLLDVNLAWLRTLGYESDQVLGKYFTDFLHPDSKPHFDIIFPAFKEGGYVSGVQFVIRHRDGHHLTISLEGCIGYTPEGKFKQTYCIFEDITEQKQVANALQIERDNLKNILGAMEDGVYIVDQQFAIEYVNPEIETEFGPYEGRKCYDYFHDREDVCPWCKNEEVFAGKTVHWEFSLAKNQKTYDLIDTPLKNPDGSISKLEILRDITERKQVEKKLQENEEKLRGLFDTMSSGVVVYDVIDDGEDFIIADCNHAVETIERVKKEDIVGKRVTQAFPGVKDFGLFEVFQRVSSTGEPENFLQALYKDEKDPGSWRDNWVYKLPSGEIVAVYNDITERKRIERELKENEQNFRDLVENLDDGVAIADENGNYLFVNQNFSKITGYSATELMKMTGWDLSRPEDQANLENKMRDRMQGKPVDTDYERIIVRKDGTEIPVEISTTTTIWQGDKCPMAIIRDISERKLEEQKKDILLHQVQEANERLRSLSRELINSQEAERKRISQELHDELGQALTAISLDLGIIEQNLHPETPPEIRDRLFDTKKNADELDQMIRELALDLRPSLLDDLGLLPTLNWYVKRFSQRAKIEVEVDVNGEEKRLPGEIETALYRIIQEALTNVVKHAKAKKVGLRIDKRADVVMVIIKDDGKGFDLDTMQSPETSTWGLGLIGMADRTALVGGDFKIYTKPGEGTRIEVEIPC